MLNEYALELAQLRADQERDATISAAMANMRCSGSDDCADCGCTIPAARRAAYPAATRCVACQEQLEREVYAR